MRYFSFFLISLLFACTEPIATDNSVKQIPEAVSSNTTDNEELKPKDTNHVDGILKQQQKCEIAGEVLEDNELWLKDQGKLICIMADSSTYDATMGMSHRILEMFDTYTCELEIKLTLPINISPDFPYFLADINYNNNSKIVAIKAAKTIYCFDMTTKRMLPLLTPTFKTKRAEVDASSGMIIRLELWEDFLVGYAQDKGAFVFDLGEEGIPQPVLPYAEYQLGEDRFNSLFLLPSETAKYQAILPSFDWEEEVFSINPIFKEPLAINTTVQKSALDNPFVVLREKQENKALLIDMKQMTNKALPPNLLTKTTKEILVWAKEN